MQTNTSDRVYTFPNDTGTLALTSDIPTLTFSADAPYMKTDGLGELEVGVVSADAPYVKIDASGQLDSSSTLTISTPLKSSALGQIEASDLDITTDITVGASLEQIRVNVAATALEYFLPSASGGRWTLVGQGTAVYDATQAASVACWYDNTQGTGIGGYSRTHL